MLLIEELSANAWPGLKNVVVDGWLVRFAKGYSRRANSVLPFRNGAGDLGARIAHCESLFRREGLPPTFKLYPGAEPGGLDQELERRGYARKATTTVQTLESLERPVVELPPGFALDVQTSLHDTWFQVYADPQGGTRGEVRHAWAIMEAIAPECRYVLLVGEDGPAACALAVVERGWVGIFDVMVRKDLRGRGLGRLVMERTLAEARRAGALHSYLQVMDDNTPAVSLYNAMGYRVSHPYWYRVKEDR